MMRSLLDLDRWHEIWSTIRRNRLRAGLTAFGVFWGVFMLLGMLGFSNGVERGLQKTMGNFATNAVHVWGRRTSLPYMGLGPGREIDYRNSDIEALRNEVEGIQYVAPRLSYGGYRGGAQVRFGTEVGSFTVMGDDPVYRNIQPMVMDAGRFLNDLDMAEERKVAVIGQVVQDELFEGTDPIGRWIDISGVWFRVVGTFHSPLASDEGERISSTIHVPFSTFQRAFNTTNEVHWFALTGVASLPGSELEKRVRTVLARRHRIHPDDEPAIGSWNTEREFGKVTTLFQGMRVFAWIVGAATLLSGVVGVSNILLISIRERTSEIGLRRALGATPWNVTQMIVMEAFVLTSLAGYVGVIAGILALEVAGWWIGPGTESMGPPSVDVATAMLSAGLLSIAGIIAGILPAQRAAAIQPVDALRTE